ncbi:MAG: hypothetical protein JGK03_31790 [Microcoleus sp. PH2017_25_DOB_D_A]|uniref:hypothetical protein n=1 Tax=unclassified Microcoleus TaxID=2642155 RepID=UPI001D6CDBFA|nr:MULTISPECIES: hypothetical protein [unclassified Microcoleus]MCC3450092.1 hypothetical protein [Microcoleus sp. PH2017_09_SFU_O_A]MCC3538657.1 hypothetical protein [Microcoleus sp. PH2017_25_DOB_D_A]MCC3551095.1 hypothetical protein [Microcoleus sp. PH2017_24_DOB_U_A]MCC3631034.1 hypothetical protein [Microcoleus sp. PH2017_39_LGB_O_B]MCC3643291.1 hypothetical protein [Microcoleus sp. PH2017_33_LGB_O_A]
MLIKSRSIESISKFSAVCMLTFAMFLGPNLDCATARDLESRTQAVDNLTDWFFYKVNPQLGDRKLRSDDSPIYIREWNAIRRTVDREMIATPGDCAGDAFWDFDYRSHGRSLVSGALEEDRVADTIWTIRDPSGDKTRADVSKQQWKKLRNLIFREHFCY